MKTAVVPEAEAKTIVSALVERQYWTAPVPEIVNSPCSALGFR